MCLLFNCKKNKYPQNNCLVIAYLGCDYLLGTEWVAIPSSALEFRSKCALDQLVNANACKPFVFKVVNPDSYDISLVNAFYDCKCKVLYVQAQVGKINLIHNVSRFVVPGGKCVGFSYSGPYTFSVPCSCLAVPISDFTYLDSED